MSPQGDIIPHSKNECQSLIPIQSRMCSTRTKIILAIVSALAGTVIFLPTYLVAQKNAQATYDREMRGECTIRNNTASLFPQCYYSDCQCRNCGDRIGCDQAQAENRPGECCDSDTCCARRVCWYVDKRCVWHCAERVHYTCLNRCGNSTTFSLDIYLAEKKALITQNHSCRFDDGDCYAFYAAKTVCTTWPCWYDGVVETPTSVLWSGTKLYRGWIAGYVFAGLLWLLSLLGIGHILYRYKSDPLSQPIIN